MCVHYLNKTISHVVLATFIEKKEKVKSGFWKATLTLHTGSRRAPVTTPDQEEDAGANRKQEVSRPASNTLVLDVKLPAARSGHFYPSLMT